MKITAESLVTLFDTATLHALNAFAEKSNTALYLVGGSVRDLLLGRQTTDIDFALAADAIQFAKAFASTLDAVCIPLEENPPTARVIAKPDNANASSRHRLSMDFAQFRAASLTEDLRLRDLTINAMAIALEEIAAFTADPEEQATVPVIDPCGGMRDLAQGRLQFISEGVVIADPVRLLRIYRFAAQLKFQILKHASDVVTKHCELLREVAAERCRDELVKIFNVKTSLPYLQQMAATGLLSVLLPAIKAEQQVWRSIRLFEENPIPAALHAYSRKINSYLQVPLGVEMDRHSGIKFGLLLGDTAAETAKRLRFSRKVVLFMKAVIAGSQVFRNGTEPLTQNRIIHFLRRYGSEWMGILLYLAAKYSVEPALLKQVAETYYEHIVPIQRQGRLITGRDLIQTFHLKEGTQIGRVLREIEKRQFEGDIRTREEALAAVYRLIQGRD